MKDLPNEVGDDEELDDTIDDANGPALHHHRLGGLIGEEVCDTRPHAGSGMQVSLTRVSVSLQWFHLSTPHPKKSCKLFQESLSFHKYWREKQKICPDPEFLLSLKYHFSLPESLLVD